MLKQQDNKELHIRVGNQDIILKGCNSESIDTDRDIVIERGEEIEKLHKDILELNEVFKDFNNYVIQQTEQIETIATNIENTHEEVNIANIEINKAEEYQFKFIKKKLILTTLAITAINAPIGLFFGAKVALATIGASLFGYFI
jgi:t-SNARE complex subunit (syntaxin)